MFSSLLIANRGEIACRIMRTARRMGIRTIAVYSTADEGALHVRSADLAVCVGAAPARESYLNIERLIAAARATGAQAVHPGYGFLSESEHFAQACEVAGIRFVGPTPHAIRAMGSKSAAKSLLEAAGVPLTPGYHGVNQDPAFLAGEAARIGYPVLIKASAGGGGKGMRRVDYPKDFGEALAACKREAAASFGSAQVLIEKYLLRPRHIEIQVFADTHGNIVHLFERDCSVQRRHQKVLEEAPAPGMTPERRAAMGKAAIQAARAVGYVGAGTVEFIVPRAVPGEAQLFYFMEMNTRLQVEHPVTECITGVDLVEWQLRVAAGEALPRSQDQLSIRGHAIEARVYAEDADGEFTPASGVIEYLETPESLANVRWDAGVAQGDAITQYYDPMIAKLIAWDADREAARGRLRGALSRTRIVGLVSNVAFLARLVDSPSFAGADLDTSLIERDQAHIAAPVRAPADEMWQLAALAQLAREAYEDSSSGRPGAWATRDSWRANLAGSRRLEMQWHAHAQSQAKSEQREFFVLGNPPSASAGETLLRNGDRAVACRLLAGGAWTQRGLPAPGGRLLARLGERVVEASVVQHAGRWHVLCGGEHNVFSVHDPLEGAGAGVAAGPDHGESLRAPMPGKVIALLAEPGKRVERGTPLLIVEAMKMEHTVRAPAAGVLESFFVQVGDQVTMEERLAEFAVEGSQAS